MIVIDEAYGKRQRFFPGREEQSDIARIERIPRVRECFHRSKSRMRFPLRSDECRQLSSRIGRYAFVQMPHGPIIYMGFRFALQTQLVACGDHVVPCPNPANSVGPLQNLHQRKHNWPQRTCIWESRWLIALAIKLAEVTLPRAMRSKIAALTSRLIPRSSAFTMACTSGVPSV